MSPVPSQAVIGAARPSGHSGLVTPNRPGHAPGPPPRRPAARAWWFLAAWLAAFGVLAASEPGRIIFDTKLGVDISPAGFYEGLWHLWNPVEWQGTLGDQSIGYAFPMGAFYLAGAAAHAPVWITERLWLSLLAAAGFWGMVKLAAALRIGSDGSRALAGAVFALWPTFTIVIGSTSAAALPGLLVPWAILPLAREGRSPVTAAARSGVAVLAMGGVNAVSTIDALLLPALFVLTRSRERRRSLAPWWVAAVVAATAWWAVPLLLQGRYSFNFLPYVEQAATTTRTMSAAAFARGSGNWTAYFNLGTPWVPAGWAIVTAPASIAASAMAAALGLYGLARRDMPEGRWLRLSVGAAALVALAGYPGPLGGPFHTQVQHLLDGPLAPFRGVYKLEQVLAAVLALGLAHALGHHWRRAGVTGRRAVRVTTVPVVAAILAGLALPYLSGQILGTGAFSRVPGYWYQVAGFLAAHSPRQAALVTPADSHGTYLWGGPIDDPLEALARSPWVERGLVPYGGGGSQDFLVTAENALESGERVPGLPAFLDRAGIRYVVVRNDLDPAMLGYTAPEIVHQTLGLSGFRRVAAFGPPLAGSATDPQASPQIQAVLPSYPAVEVYEAVSAAQQPAGPVTASPVSRTVLVNGGPGSLLQLESQGLLGPRPAVVAGDRPAAPPPGWLVTDGLRRADNAFGLINSNVSYTFTAAETNPVDNALGGGGGPPRQLLPVPAPGHQTVAVLSGAAQVTASSYGAWLAETPQYDPVNAFDGDPSTAWAEGNPVTPDGQWIQITFDHPVNLPRTVGIRLLDDNPIRGLADRVQVTTAAGRVSTSLAASGSTQPLRMPPGPSRWLRLTITGARGVLPGGPGAGISDILIPGVRVTRYLQPPEASRPGAPNAYSFQQQVPSPSSLADPAAYPPLARTFTTAGRESLRVRAAAVALPGPALDTVLDRLAPAGKSVLHVSASSTLGSLPQFSPDNLFTGPGQVPWIAGSANPVLSLSWQGKRRITGLAVEPTSGISAVPESVRITSPAGTRTAPVGFGGLVQFPALVTDRIDITFPTVATASITNPISGQLSPLPIGIQRLSIPALAGLHVSAPNPGAPFRLPCGQGPGLTVDGKKYPTSVSGTFGDLTQFLPMPVQLCTPGGRVSLGAGPHTLTAAAPGVFSVTDVSLARPAAPATSGGSPRTMRVTTWQADHRQVQVGPGGASYLEVHENFNPGWVATLAGRRLPSVRLDGWQQAFVVPAGPGGTVNLSYQPAGVYHVGLIASAAAVLALLVAALGLFGLFGLLARVRPRRRRRAWQDPGEAGASSHLAPGDGGGSWHLAPGEAGASSHLVLGEGGGSSHLALGEGGGSSHAAPGAPGVSSATQPAANGEVGSSFPWNLRKTRPDPRARWTARGLAGRRWAHWAGRVGRLVPLGALMVVVGGPVALAVPVLAAVKYRWPRWIPWLALAAMVAAGGLAAAAAQPATLGAGTFGAPAQACTLIALAAALTPVLPGVRGRGRGARGGGDPERAGLPGPGATAAPGGDGTLARVSFGIIDELSCYYDAPGEPANVHLEARVAGHLDEAALRAAVLAALAARPRARGRRAPGRRWRRRYTWEFPREPDCDPVQRATWSGERDLAREREAFLAAVPSLDSSPPVRLLLAAGPDQDCVILNAHHAALDGRSCLQLLREIAGHYSTRVSAAGSADGDCAAASEPRAPADTESVAAAPAPAPVGPASASAPPPGRGLPFPAARIAAHHEDPGSGAAQPGYGFCLMTVPDVPSAVPGATVNDVLVAAMIMAVAQWNGFHGRARGRIRITMPLGGRTGGAALGNLSSLASVTARLPRHGVSYRGLLADVARQTRYAKTNPRPQADPVSRALVAAWLPARVKHRLVRTALRILGPVQCDTSLVSNLGDVAGPPSFGSAATTGMWFSTAAHMPRGLSAGVITVGGRVHLCLRYRRALLDERAAAHFAGEYLSALAALAASGPGRCEP